MGLTSGASCGRCNSGIFRNRNIGDRAHRSHGCGSLDAWKFVTMAMTTHVQWDNSRELVDKLTAMTADSARPLEPPGVASCFCWCNRARSWK